MMATLAKIQHIPQYVSQLRSDIGYYIGWIPNAYADQVTADSYYEVIRKDPEIHRCLHLLSLMVAGERIKVQTENERLKEISLWALNQMRDALHSRKSLIEKGVLFGLGIQRKFYTIRKKYGIPWAVCYRAQEVDRRRIRIERNPENKNDLYYTIWSPLHDQYVILEDRSENPQAPLGCGIQDYIWYMHTYEETSPYGEGFGEVLYLLAYYKQLAMQYWGDLAERWSKPFMVVSIDVMKAAITRSLGSGYSTLQGRIDSVLETFEKCRSNHIAVVDQNDKINMFEAGSTGANIIRELVEYCDKKIQLNLLASELATTTGGVGSYALGAVHRQGLETVILYNRLRLAEKLGDDILYDFYYRNPASMRYLGLGVPERGEVKLKIEVEEEEARKQQQAEAQQKGAGQMPAPI